MELSIVADRMSGETELLDSAGMEAPAEGRDAEAEVHDLARELLYGWPSVGQEPTGMRAQGRFPKAFPLEFPMGIGDLWDPRPVPVTAAEWARDFRSQPKPKPSRRSTACELFRPEFAADFQNGPANGDAEVSEEKIEK